jgi:hypothetical protein
MARKATVDIDKVLGMLQEGQSTQSVAEHFGVSRQAIDLHRHKFIQSGQLQDKRAPRVAAASSIHNAALVQKPEPDKEKNKGPEEVSLDKLIELLIQAFDSLKKMPKLEAELEKYRQDYQKAAEKIEQLEKAVSKRNEQEARWRLVVPPEGGKSRS